MRCPKVVTSSLQQLVAARTLQDLWDADAAANVLRISRGPMAKIRQQDVLPTLILTARARSNILHILTSAAGQPTNGSIADNGVWTLACTNAVFHVLWCRTGPERMWFVQQTGAHHVNVLSEPIIVVPALPRQQGTGRQGRKGAYSHRLVVLCFLHTAMTIKLTIRLCHDQNLHQRHVIIACRAGQRHGRHLPLYPGCIPSAA